jgi:hypothetical protein
MLRPPAAPDDPWYRGKSLARLFCFISFAAAPLGIGLLDSIPSTEMLLMLAGWFAAPEPVPANRANMYHPQPSPWGRRSDMRVTA